MALQIAFTEVKGLQFVLSTLVLKAYASYAHNPLNFSLSCSLAIEKAHRKAQWNCKFRMKAKEADVKEKIFTSKP